MENALFTGEIPTKTSIHRRFSSQPCLMKPDGSVRKVIGSAIPTFTMFMATNMYEPYGWLMDTHMAISQAPSLTPASAPHECAASPVMPGGKDGLMAFGITRSQQFSVQE